MIDGWHRWEAHKKAGATTIRVRVTHVGGEQPASGLTPGAYLTEDVDHFATAVSRNATHGLQLPIEVEREIRDKRVATERLAQSKADPIAEGVRIAERLRKHKQEFMTVGIPAQIAAQRDLIVMIDRLNPEEKKQFWEELSPTDKQWIKRQRELLDPTQFEIRVKATQLEWLQEPE
jgi:hypothetical protein